MKLLKTVYSLIYPESRQILSNLWQSQPLFLYEKAYDKHQDKYHEEFLAQWKKWSSPVLQVDYQSFPYTYPTAGSTEGLRETLVSYANESRIAGREPVLHVFQGEYEGYEAQAKGYGIKIIKHERANWQKSLPKVQAHDFFFLSHPSAIDGNIWTDYDSFMTELNKITNARALVDVCYVGCIAKDFTINLNYPVIERFCFSLSKVFGVYYHRIGGLFSKTPLTGLQGNIWFKNLFSLYLGQELLKSFSVYELPRKYQNLQTEALLNFPTLQASDVIILAHGPSSLINYQEYNRGPNCRVCLTPTMDEELCKISKS